MKHNKAMSPLAAASRRPRVLASVGLPVGTSERQP